MGEVAGAAGAGGAAGGGAGGGTSGGGGASAAAGGAGGGASAPGAQAGAPGAAAAGTGGGGATDWTASLSEDARGYVQNKAWKTPDDVITSARNLEKLIGHSQEKIIKLPADDDLAGWDSVFTRLGKPADAKGYKIEVPKGGDPEFATWAGDAFHKANLSDKQAAKLLESWNGRLQAQTQAQKDGQTQVVKAQETALRKEWGMAYEQNFAIAKQAARQFGVEKFVAGFEQVMGAAESMKFFHRLGLSGVEPGFVQGRGISGDAVLTPTQARQQISALKADPSFSKRISQGDASARAQLERLHQHAYPGNVGDH